MERAIEMKDGDSRSSTDKQRHTSDNYRRDVRPDRPSNPRTSSTMDSRVGLS